MILHIKQFFNYDYSRTPHKKGGRNLGAASQIKYAFRAEFSQMIQLKPVTSFHLPQNPNRPQKRKKFFVISWTGSSTYCFSVKKIEDIMFHFAIDRGGTFTDVIVKLPSGELKVLKVRIRHMIFFVCRTALSNRVGAWKRETRSRSWTLGVGSYLYSELF